MATTPAHVIELFGQALNARDIDRALALYQSDAAFVPQPGTTVHGLPAIREALSGFTAIHPHITAEVIKVVDSGDLALVVAAWELTGRQPDGAPLALAGRSADVLRRQADGSWLIAIDDPWGGGA
jgi:uncharacterized protein (TIGR02246 family)